MRTVLVTLGLALALAAAGCDGGGDDDPPVTATANSAATESAESAAQRPEWFPARFPLPADTVVASAEPGTSGGGTVEFTAPLGFSRVINIMQLNLESPSHRFIIVSQDAGESEAVFEIDDQDGEYTGTVIVRPAGTGSTISVELAPK